MNTDRNIYQSIILLALGTVFLLLIPLIAMKFSDEVVWTLSDFILAGTFIFGTGLTYQLITRNSDKFSYRIAIGFALATGLLLIWINLAVGIIGSENEPFNLIYFGVIAVGIIGAFIVRFQSHKMVLVMFAMAFAQTLCIVIAFFGDMHQLPGSSITEILGVNAFFIFLFVISALLFQYSSREQVSL